MGEYFRKQLRKRGTAKFNILALLILILVMRLFFYPPFSYAFSLNQEDIDISGAIQEALENNKLEGINLETFDPLQKIGLSSFEKKPAPAAQSELPKAIETGENAETLKYREILKGSPMEAMAVEIGKKDKKVAAFLIGIGKKESSWGKHSPKDHGEECYNYWGYRGKENTTESGYSCFDSPEHAISVVGGKIEKLIGQKIDTPERMIVWKCGRTCAGHDPAGVKKWISDVSKYYYALKS